MVNEPPAGFSRAMVIVPFIGTPLISVTLPVIVPEAPGVGDGEGEGLGFGDGEGDGDGNGEGDGDGLGVAVGVGVGLGELLLTEPQPAMARKYENEITTLRYKGNFPLRFMNNLWWEQKNRNYL